MSNSLSNKQSLTQYGEPSFQLFGKHCWKSVLIKYHLFAQEASTIFSLRGTSHVVLWFSHSQSRTLPDINVHYLCERTLSSLKCLLLHEPIGMTPFVLVIIADVSKRLRCRRFDVTFYYKRQSGVINHRFAPHDEVSTRTVNLSYQRGTKLSQKKREGYTSG